MLPEAGLPHHLRRPNYPIYQYMETYGIDGIGAGFRPSCLRQGKERQTCTRSEGRILLNASGSAVDGVPGGERDLPF